MKTLREIDLQALPLKLAEALAPILKAIDAELTNIKIAEEWIDELTEMMARRVCKSRPDLPAWSKLTAAQQRVCRTSAKKHIEAMANFFYTKIDVKKNG